MNVQISSRGRKLLANRNLATRVLKSLIINNDKLQAGEDVHVKIDSSNPKEISLKMVSSISKETEAK